MKQFVYIQITSSVDSNVWATFDAKRQCLERKKQLNKQNERNTCGQHKIVHEMSNALSYYRNICFFNETLARRNTKQTKSPTMLDSRYVDGFFSWFVFIEHTLVVPLHSEKVWVFFSVESSSARVFRLRTQKYRFSHNFHWFFQLGKRDPNKSISVNCTDWHFFWTFHALVAGHFNSIIGKNRFNGKKGFLQCKPFRFIRQQIKIVKIDRFSTLCQYSANNAPFIVGCVFLLLILCCCAHVCGFDFVPKIYWIVAIKTVEVVNITYVFVYRFCQMRYDSSIRKPFVKRWTVGISHLTAFKLIEACIFRMHEYRRQIQTSVLRSTAQWKRKATIKTIMARKQTWHSDFQTVNMLRMLNDRNALDSMKCSFPIDIRARRRTQLHMKLRTAAISLICRSQSMIVRRDLRRSIEKHASLNLDNDYRWKLPIFMDVYIDKLILDFIASQISTKYSFVFAQLPAKATEYRCSIAFGLILLDETMPIWCTQGHSLGMCAANVKYLFSCSSCKMAVACQSDFKPIVMHKTCTVATNCIIL